jgi:hypothetical protein
MIMRHRIVADRIEKYKGRYASDQICDAKFDLNDALTRQARRVRHHFTTCPAGFGGCCNGLQ